MFDYLHIKTFGRVNLLEGLRVWILPLVNDQGIMTDVGDGQSSNARIPSHLPMHAPLTAGHGLTLRLLKDRPSDQYALDIGFSLKVEGMIPELDKEACRENDFR